MRQDIIVENGDVVTNGDFVVGHSDQQHVGDIFITQPGEYKEWPILGFGVLRCVKTNKRASKFKRDLKLMLEFDGYANADIDVTDGIENTKISI